MRLIDADALKEMLGGIRAYYNCFDEDEKKFYEAYSKAIEILNIYLDKKPTVDAVDVVRCGECKHLMADGRCFEFADDSLRPSANDFCSYGERRSEDAQA